MSLGKGLHDFLVERTGGPVDRHLVAIEEPAPVHLFYPASGLSEADVLRVVEDLREAVGWAEAQLLKRRFQRRCARAAEACSYYFHTASLRG